MDLSGNERPKRCQFPNCKKKLLLTDFPCRCKGYYCANHRLSESHVCPFDYKKEGKDLLKKTLGDAVVGTKLVQI